MTVPFSAPKRAKHVAAFISQHRLQFFAALAWLTLVGSYAWYYYSQGLTADLAIAQIVRLLASPWGPVLYILLYTVRPLLFFSSTVLTVTAGAIFGAGSFWNLAVTVLYTMIGSNLSASLAYSIGRFFGSGLLNLAPEKSGVVWRYVERMRRNSFETVLLMRLIFLPYDLVNYLSGILRIRWSAFALATCLGSLPGTLAFVSFGASIDLKQIALGQRPTINPWLIGFALTILVLSLSFSRYSKRHAA